MKKLITSSLLMMMAVFTLSAANYKVDDQVIDQLFNNATETSITSVDLFGQNNSLDNSVFASVSSDDNVKKLIIACVVDYIGGGLFGIHRYILGTKSNMWAIYTFTVCGIFGIVPAVDFWVMLIDGIIMEHPDSYIGNEKFFMWF